jgi:hypothetical protein
MKASPAIHTRAVRGAIADMPIVTWALIAVMGVATSWAQILTVPQNTPVRLRLTEALSSESSKVGDPVQLEALEDVSVNGQVVIRRNAPAHATISQAQRKRHLGRAGLLAVAVQYVNGVDGSHIQVSGERLQKGNSGAARIGLGMGVATASVVGIPALPFLLLIHGHETAIPMGTTVETYVAADAQVDMVKVQAQPTGQEANTGSRKAPDMTAERCLGVRFAGNPTVRHDGVEIVGIQAGGPADIVAMRPGDRILAIDNHFLYTIDELRAELLRHNAGAQVPIRYQRNALIYDSFVVLLSNTPGN